MSLSNLPTVSQPVLITKLVSSGSPSMRVSSYSSLAESNRLHQLSDRLSPGTVILVGFKPTTYCLGDSRAIRCATGPFTT